MTNYRKGDTVKILGVESENDILKEIGLRIKQYRISLNITQTELADRCGVSLSTVVRIENGIDSKLSNYIRILNIFGMVQNLDILIPEAQPDFKALFENKPARQRVKSKNIKKKTGWVWGEDE